MEITTSTTLPLAEGILLLATEAVPSAALAAPSTTLAARLSSLADNSPITISDVRRTLANNTLQVSGLVNVLGQANLPLTLSAAVGPGPEMLQLQAILQLPQVQSPLPLLWRRLSLPAPLPSYLPTSLPVSSLTLAADSAGTFSLVAAAATGCALDLGPAQPPGLQLTNLKLTVRKPNGASAVSRLGGELKLSDALTLTMDCDTTGSFSLGAQLPATTLRQLVANVTQQNLPRPASPDWFDLAFGEGGVMVSCEDAGLALRATGTVGGIRVVLQARRAVAGTWDFALGLGLPDGAALSPPALEQVRQLCRLSSLLLVFASYDDASFSLASLLAPGSPAASKPLALSGGLQQGLTAYASWRLDGKDPVVQRLAKLMALPSDLAVLLHLDAALTGGRLAVGAQFALNNSSNPLTFDGAFGCELEAGRAGLFLDGKMKTRLQGQELRCNVEGEFLPTGVLLSGSMLGTVRFEPLPVSLSNLALVVGINVEGVPSLGLAGTLAVQDFQSSVAVFFDSSDPRCSMLAGSVSNLTLAQVLSTFTKAKAPPALQGILNTVQLTGTASIGLPDQNNKLTDALRARQLDALASALRKQGVQLTRDPQNTLLVAGSSGNTWFLTDSGVVPPVHYELTKSPQDKTLTVSINPQLYCAPQDTSLGQLVFKQGLFINAKLRILAYEALVNIKMSLQEGLVVEGSLNQPIVVGHEQLFSITAEADARKGARVSVVTQIEAKPHFTIDGKVTMLGWRLGIYVDVSPSGFAFQIYDTPQRGVYVQLKGSFTGPTSLLAGGSLLVGLDGAPLDLGPLGSLPLSTNAQGSLTLEVSPTTANSQDPVRATATFKGTVRALGREISFTLPLDFTSPSPLSVQQQLARALVNELRPMLLDGRTWLNYVRQGLITGVPDTSRVLVDVYKLSRLQVSIFYQQAGMSAEQVGAALKNSLGVATPTEAATLLRLFPTGQVQSTLQTLYKLDNNQLAATLKAANYSIQEIGNSLRDTGKLGYQDVAKVLKSAGYGVDDLYAYLKSNFSFSVTELPGLFSFIKGL